jgi:hypothetical protein
MKKFFLIALACLLLPSIANAEWTGGAWDSMSPTAANAAYFQKANNLSEGTAATMRTNLGLSATSNVTFLDLILTSGDAAAFTATAFKATTATIVDLNLTSGDATGYTIGEFKFTTATGGHLHATADLSAYTATSGTVNALNFTTATGGHLHATADLSAYTATTGTVGVLDFTTANGGHLHASGDFSAFTGTTGSVGTLNITAGTATALTIGTSPVSAFIQTLVDDADAATARGTLGVSPELAQGNTWFVTSSGDDANSGTSMNLAKKTVTAALTAATAGDTIMLMAAAWNESITITKNIQIVAPGASFGQSATAGPFIISGTGVEAKIVAAQVGAAGFAAIKNMGANSVSLTCRKFWSSGTGGSLYSDDNASASLYASVLSATDAAATAQTWFNGINGLVDIRGNILLCLVAGSTIFSPAAGSNIIFDFDSVFDPTLTGGSASTLIAGSPGTAATVVGRAGYLKFGTISNINANVTASIAAGSWTGTGAQSGAGRVIVSDATYPGTVTVALKCGADTAIATTGDGKVYYTFPYPGTWELAASGASCYSAGDAGGAATSLHLYNVTAAADMHGVTPVTIDAGEVTSATAAAAPTISATPTVSQYDRIRWDVTAVTADSQGLEAWARFRRKSP